MTRPFSSLFTLLLSLIPLQAEAYIGPGLGLGMASVVIGIFIAFCLLLAGLIWLPIRRFLRQRKLKKDPPQTEG